MTERSWLIPTSKTAIAKTAAVTLMFRVARILPDALVSDRNTSFTNAFGTSLHAGLSARSSSARCMTSIATPVQASVPMTGQPSCRCSRLRSTTRNPPSELGSATEPPTPIAAYPHNQHSRRTMNPSAAPLLRPRRVWRGGTCT